MAIDDSDILEQVERHLTTPCQSWLFGAGISKFPSGNSEASRTADESCARLLAFSRRP